MPQHFLLPKSKSRQQLGFPGNGAKMIQSFFQRQERSRHAWIEPLELVQSHRLIYRQITACDAAKALQMCTATKKFPHVSRQSPNISSTRTGHLNFNLIVAQL